MQHSKELHPSRKRRSRRAIGGVVGRRNPSCPGASGQRRGLATLEVILVLPILVLMTVAIIQFGIIVVVEQAVTHAATVAAREAGKGADADELTCVVETVLASHCIKIGPKASLVLEDPTATEPVEQRGALPCCPPSGTSLDPDEVRVTLCVDLGRKPFLNALKCVGVDLAGRRFVVSSVVKKEQSG